MNIIKQLNLNGNAQVVPNGSLVFAKNIKLSEDGTSIMSDDGFVSPFYENETMDFDSIKDDLKVQSVKGDFIKLELLIDNGVIQGYKFQTETYTETRDNVDVEITKEYNAINFVGYINCPNEIVLFCTVEYNIYVSSTVEETGKEDVILRIVESKSEDVYYVFRVHSAWQYNNGKIIGTYNYNVNQELIIAIAESDANIDKQLLTINLNTSLDSDNLDSYSCAPKVPIANLYLNGKVKGKAIPHGLYFFYIRYKFSDKLYSNWFPIGAPQYALSLDYKTIFNHTYPVELNETTTTRMTTGSLLVNTEKDSFYNFDFTIRFDNTHSYLGFQIGYILQTDDTAVGRIWNGFNFNSNELSKSFIFNGGYIEDVDIEELTKNVINVYDVKALTNYNSKLYIANFKETEYNVDLTDYAKDIKTYLVSKIVDLDNIDKQTTNIETWTYTIENTPINITVPAGVTSIPLKSIPDFVNHINRAIRWYRLFPDYDPSINGIIGVLGEDARLVLSTSLSFSWSLPNSTLGDRFYYSEVYNNYHFLSGLNGSNLDGELNADKIKISMVGGQNSYSTYNTDNIIRTLMPYEVYAFYVHYVRPDGSYTNGIPLENQKELDENSYLYKTVQDILNISDETERNRILNEYNITDIATIDEIKDRYLYELYVPLSAYSITEFDIYLDYNGKKLFRTPAGLYHSGDEVKLTQLGVRFENIKVPTGYVGVFFSYEKINSLSVYQGVVLANNLNNSNILVKANDVEYANTRYDGALFIPHHKVDISGTPEYIGSIESEPFYGYINNAAPVLSNSVINFEGYDVNRIGAEGGIVMNLSINDSSLYNPAPGTVGNVIIFNRSIYNNEVKELIPLGLINTETYEEGGILYFKPYGEERKNENDFTGIINYDMNYPSFLTKEKLLYYNDEIAIDEEGKVNIIEGTIIKRDNYFNNANYATVSYIWKYSNIALETLTIKKEPEHTAGIITDNEISVNTFVSPVNASDLFKLESCYIPQIHKAYTNYDKTKKPLERFTNVIRHSYPIRNESTINSWRLFNSENYHVINSVNGEIVHIFGAGNQFYIHTKNNLLVTSANAKITADNTNIELAQHQLFDMEPQEVFTSDLGYGGIKYNNCQLFSQLGYIWYDTDRRKLFRYDNGGLISLSDGIDNILKKYNFEKCYINIDNKSNRIFFCFDTEQEGDNRYLTLGYNTITNKWLSIYDFYFTNSIHTISKLMFSNDRFFFIYGYDVENMLLYLNLYYANSDFPRYYKILARRTTMAGMCFDVILNLEYMTPKVLNSISWAFDVVTPLTLDKDKIAQLEIVNPILEKYKDLTDVKVIVYTDAVDSGELDLYHDKLNDVANVNNPNAYKYPYYNKGVWNLSYFRNNITTEVTETELNTLAEQYGISVDKLKDVYKAIDRNGNPVYRKSDLRSLIYGKYIVVRFIFIHIGKIKFDNVEFKIEKY